MIKMKIVVLDSYTLNPGDLSWSELMALGEVVLFERTQHNQIVERALDAEVILTNKTALCAETLSQLPNLKYIGVLATGYNIVDIEAARSLGIIVSNVPDYSTASVSQLVFALLLELCQHVQVHSDSVKAGEWVSCADFSYTKTPLLELEGKTMGIIGMGQIGKQVARIADAMGMNVIAATRSKSIADGFSFVKSAEIQEVLANSDVISLHCPLTPLTSNLINKDSLIQMKQTAFLLNTSRGGLINEGELADALNLGRIAGAGLDVLSTEPPTADNPLLSARNCLITPHIAWATQEARGRLMAVAVNNVKGYLNQDPVNRIC
jgi:glycerate dehydrogenase